MSDFIDRFLLKKSRRGGQDAYTVTINERKYNSLRIVLNPRCGLELGEKVYQVKRKDGVVELIPARLYKEMTEKYSIVPLDPPDETKKT